MNSAKKILFVFLLLFVCHVQGQTNDKIFIRINQYGYLQQESKSVLIFSNEPVKENFEVINTATNKTAGIFQPDRLKVKGWGRFNYYYRLDLSDLTKKGRYKIKGRKSGILSRSFQVSDKIYNGTPEKLLIFMRQQRCGYNPFLDKICHQLDGKTFYGDLPDSSFVDVSGGWHDAGDQLKYLITGSYATAHMLKTYELYPSRFADHVNALGQPVPNGIADILDEAKWGLDWILKLHVSPDQLIHQVGDDRDHIGWKMPYGDQSDYGWGPGSYRIAYFADGKPQGLNKYKSKATGVANLAGRSAAALALGARIWKKTDPVFATRCLKAAQTVYHLGKEKEGYQQGNSYLAPYRYGEITWADDMEWGAAELYKLTQKKMYLDDAKDYAVKANVDSWLVRDTASHYQYYPFINMGHFALYDLVDNKFKKKLSGYYKTEIKNIAGRAGNSPYGIGIPFIWCSNNLMTSFITQVILYEKMTGDMQFHQLALDHRDWLFGRNPWGTSMFTGMPEQGEYPLDVHTSIWALTKEMVPGGLVDGPIYRSIYKSLIGIHLNQPDEFARFQNNFVVYHDDIGDYSTNEPTMDGTAGSLMLMAHFSTEISKEKSKTGRHKD
jgi:hypothetical protein